MKITVTGSLGNISRPLAARLLRQGHEVTIVSSSAERAPEIEAMGATAAVGSLEDSGFLAGVFSGSDAAYCMIPPNFRELDQLQYYQKIGESYRAAIAESGMGRVVHLSSWGAHRDAGTGIILGSHHVEQILNSLPGVAVTHLRAGSIFYNLYNFIPMVKNAGFIGANYGESDKIVWVHPEDIAEAAAEELAMQKPAGQDVRYVASDEKTASETAKILGEAIGRPDLKWMLFTDEQAKDGMLQNGIPESIAAALVDLNASIHSGAMGEDYELHRPTKMGRFKTEDFAKEFAAAFQNS